MTVPEYLSFGVDELLTFLVDGRLLEKGESISLTEHMAAFPRQPSLERWHYDIDNLSRQKKLCHLIVGKKLASVHDRAKKLNAACPDITCGPLFFRERDDGMGFLCLEYFQGETLDSLIEQGRCNSTLWLECVRGVQKVLESTRQLSTQKHLVEEVRSLIDEACGYPGISEFDTEFLRGPVQRSILTGALANPIHKQWSNGDFAGRNLLVNSHGDVRLIDYEYAEITHFGHEDWLRLIEFSIIPPGLDENSIPEIKVARQPWREVRLWIHQLAHLKSALPSPVVMQHVTEAVGRLVCAVAGTIPPDSTNEADSLLIKLISDRQLKAESMIAERTAWAKSLEAELQTTRKNFASLSDEHSERSVWAKSLEAQLTRTQGDFERVSREFDERAAWALKLEAELKTIRSSCGQQSKTISELSEERARLNAELDAILELKDKSESELAEINSQCAALSTCLPGGSTKGAAVILEQVLVALAEFKRDLAIEKAETDRVAAGRLEARLTADAAVSEVQRLASALYDAQIHIEGLLRQSVDLRERNNFLETSTIEMEHKLREIMRQLGACPLQ